MKEKKLSNNIIYSIVMQTAGVIAPLIISPYIARVLSAELIGDYSYTLANSSYFVLAECLGFSLYGTIKIAAVRDLTLIHNSEPTRLGRNSYDY